jgi:hypothetical protein
MQISKKQCGTIRKAGAKVASPTKDTQSLAAKVLFASILFYIFNL